ncbi:MAG: hypothetical protein KBG47_03855 [Bacteroidia bacterium]|jgi:hypothetical protein|nr:hypothetical protein [Sphingobacteriaceae bacterium]MBP9068615.1 hypothetical protein [Bacteroidia bacterium]
MTATTKFESIEKEKIGELRFPQTEVLTDKEKIQDRENNLKRALTLGNLERTKTRIFFEDELGLKVVETTVWGVTDKRIILKHGVVIPIQRVHAIVI